MSLVDDFDPNDGEYDFAAESYRVVVTRHCGTGVAVREEWYDPHRDVLSRQEGPALICRDAETGKKTQVFYFMNGRPWVPEGFDDFHLQGEDAENAPEGRCQAFAGYSLEQHRRLGLGNLSRQSGDEPGMPIWGPESK